MVPVQGGTIYNPLGLWFGTIFGRCSVWVIFWWLLIYRWLLCLLFTSRGLRTSFWAGYFSSHQPRNCEGVLGEGSLYYLQRPLYFLGGRSGHNEVMAHCFAQVAGDYVTGNMLGKETESESLSIDEFNLLGKVMKLQGTNNDSWRGSMIIASSVIPNTVVIILPTRTMHCYQWNPSKLPKICIVWFPQKTANLMTPDIANQDFWILLYTTKTQQKNSTDDSKRPTPA